MPHRRITCLNEDNISCTFTSGFDPWLLENCEGIYETQNDVRTSENTMTDGSTFQSSQTKMRNIVLTLRDRPESDHQANRKLLYNLFKPKSAGVFTYEEDSTIRQIEYYVESVTIDSVPRSRRATVSLLCPDPFFTEPEELSVQMAGWVGAFEFEHEFSSAGEEFGYRVSSRLNAIENESAADYIGITVVIEAMGPASSPTITHVEQGESISIGTASNPLSLETGDKVIITTHTNNKHVYLVHSGEQTEINEYLSEDSEFIQLMRGTNTIGYSALSGENYLSVTISYRYRYLGV